MKKYLVGGAVRDHYLGMQSKDLDYLVMADSYEEMREEVIRLGCVIKVDTPEYGVIRAVHPVKGGLDFALPREDFNHDGRHAETRFVNSVVEDLARRDFTMNAIAIEVDDDLNLTDNVIDPFSGRQHIRKQTICFVRDAKERIIEDELRILRAIRFSVTKEMEMSKSTKEAIMESFLSNKVSNERIMDELNKILRHSDLEQLFLVLQKYNKTYLLKRIKAKITT